MPDNNLPASAGPVDTTPPTQTQLVEDISDLLDDPATDPVEEPEDADAVDAEPEDDPLGLDADAEADEETGADEPDDQPEIKGGRFAPDTAKVTLDDGTVITVKELKRNNLYHAGFTQKTQELAKEREAFATERQQVTEYAQSLDQSRDYLAWYAENFLPKQPEPFNGAPDDYVGFLEWQRKQAEWQTHAQAYANFQQQKQQETERKTGETQKQANDRLVKERSALLDAIPVLKDPVKGKAAWDAIVSGAQQHFGITPEEVNTVGDHRMLVALRAAVAYMRIKAKAPQVQAQVAQKPVKPGKRAAPQTASVRARQDRTERLRNSGKLDDFVAATSHLFE